MTTENDLLLVESRGGTGLTHIVSPDDPSVTACGRPIAGNGQYGHQWREDLVPAPWLGDPAGKRQRTLADVRRNQGHTLGVCKRCLKKADPDG